MLIQACLPCTTCACSAITAHKTDSRVRAKQKYGRKGEDLYIDVPVGTLVYQLIEAPRMVDEEEDEAPELNRTGTGEGVLVTGQGGAMFYEVTEDPEEDFDEDES